jgi:hypothetical protein
MVELEAHYKFICFLAQISKNRIHKITSQKMAQENTQPLNELKKQEAQLRFVNKSRDLWLTLCYIIYVPDILHPFSYCKNVYCLFNKLYYQFEQRIEKIEFFL